jgi:hypothetical protein
MSEVYLKIVPADMDFVPAADSYPKAIATLERFFPDGEECETTVYSSVSFIDQGEYIEAIHCSVCGRTTRVDYLGGEDDPGRRLWDYTMDRLDDTPAANVDLQMPCCGTLVPFTQLTFDWPAAFARFELSIHNPEPEESLNEAQLAELEAIFGCKLKQVWAHY